MYSTVHKSVLLNESLDALGVGSGKFLRIFDGTLGGAGHSEAILSASTEVRLLAVDRDKSAIERAANKLERFSDRFIVKQANFSDLEVLLSQFTEQELAVMLWEVEDQKCFDGILLDLGISSDQLDDSGRGFSFKHSENLDMRMDPSVGETAEEVLNMSSYAELNRVFKRGGVGAASSFIAKEVVKRRPIGSAQAFSQICIDVYSRMNKKGGSHFATVPFQALRMRVNRELESIEKFLQIATAYLAPGGVLAVICFHSLEDKLVTKAMRGWSRLSSEQFRIFDETKPTGEILTKKAITANQQEIQENPRSRSAMLRVFRKNI